MPYGELREGDILEDQVTAATAPSAWADAFQLQAAAALESQWLTVPISAGKPPSHAIGAGSVVWTTSATGGLHWLITADAAQGVPLTISIPGSQIVRHRSEFIGGRIFIGGNVSSVQARIMYELSYGTPVPLVAQSILGTIYSGAGPGAGSVAVHTIDWSGAPLVLSSDTDYYFKAETPGGATGTVEVYGVQLLPRFPLTPNP